MHTHVPVVISLYMLYYVSAVCSTALLQRMDNLHNCIWS